MALRNYLVGEVEDFVDGLLTRKEALRRLTLLGLSVSSATALLAACGDGGGRTGGAASPAEAPTPAPAPHHNPRKNRDDQVGGTGAFCRPGR